MRDRILLMFCVAALSACSLGERPVEVRGRESVVEFLGRWQSASAAGDTTALRAMLSVEPGFFWVEDGAVRYPDAAQFLAAVGAAGASGASTDWGLPMVQLLGPDGAAAGSTYTATFGTGPQTFRFSGYLSVALRWEEGGWRVASGHTSTLDPSAAH